MSLQDFQPIFTALIAAVGAVIAAMVPIYVPRAITAFEAYTKIKLTDQQRAAVMQAAQTEAGIVETKLQQGALHLSEVTPSSPAMLVAADAALARAPVSAAAVGTTPAEMAAIIVGAADTTKAAPSPLAAITAPVVTAAEPVLPPTKGTRNDTDTRR